MTVTAAMAAAGSAKLYDMVTAVPEQTLTALEFNIVVPATAVVIAGGDRRLPADRFGRNPTAPDTVCPASFTDRLKAHRQARFPVGLLQAAFDIKVEDGQAWRPTRGSSWLTGMPLDSEPHQQAAARTLRARRPAEVRRRGRRGARGVPRRAAGVAADGPLRLYSAIG